MADKEDLQTREVLRLDAMEVAEVRERVLNVETSGDYGEVELAWLEENNYPLRYFVDHMFERVIQADGQDAAYEVRAGFLLASRVVRELADIHHVSMPIRSLEEVRLEIQNYSKLAAAREQLERIIGGSDLSLYPGVEELLNSSKKDTVKTGITVYLLLHSNLLVLAQE